MTDDELTVDDRALLDRRWHGLITVAPGGARLPAPRPVWSEVTEDGLRRLVLHPRRITRGPA